MLFSQEDLAARHWLAVKAKDAGFQVRADPAGNLFIRWEGSEPCLPAVATGSHTDAIPNAGKYDGVVGVLGGLEAMRQLKEGGHLPKRSIELIMFTAEEPTRFGIGCLGSRLMAGTTTPDQARAGEFYSLLFGWRMVAGADLHDAQPGEYFHILNGNDMVGGISPPEQRDPNAPPHWLTYFEAQSCSEATARAKSLGGTAYVENMAISEEGHISVVADPQGATFGIHAKQR